MIRDNYNNDGFQSYGSASNMSQGRLASQDSQIQDFITPTAASVICGRGKKVFEHEGNVNFRSIVMSKLPEYKAAVSKAQKSAVVSSVFDEVTVEGNFIKQNPQTGMWYVVNEAAAREKISQCFRDCLNDKYDASKLSTKTTAAKKRKQTTTTRVPPVKPSSSPEPLPAYKESQSLPLSPIPPAPKRTKLFRNNTAPAKMAYSSSDAFQQLVMFSRSVMPPPPQVRRSSSLRPISSTSFSNPTSTLDDMEPLRFENLEPISFPSISFPTTNDTDFDLEPTPLPFRGNAAGQRNTSHSPHSL